MGIKIEGRCKEKSKLVNKWVGEFFGNKFKEDKWEVSRVDDVFFRKISMEDNLLLTTKFES